MIFAVSSVETTVSPIDIGSKSKWDKRPIWDQALFEKIAIVYGVFHLHQAKLCTRVSAPSMPA